MATSEGAAMKELFRLIQRVDKLTDGQAHVYLDEDNDDTIDEDDPLTFYLDIKPNDGLYEGAKCNFKVVLENYPEDPPCVTCCNVIYHPNIDLKDECVNGSVCVNLLGSDWTPEVGLDGCVIAILFLFYNPQLDDALSPLFSGSDMDEEEFAENVRLSIRGEEIDGYVFDMILEDGDAEIKDKGVCENKDGEVDENKNEGVDEGKNEGVDKNKIEGVDENKIEGVDENKIEDLDENREGGANENNNAARSDDLRSESESKIMIEKSHVESGEDENKYLTADQPLVEEKEKVCVPVHDVTTDSHNANVPPFLAVSASSQISDIFITETEKQKMINRENANNNISFSKRIAIKLNIFGRLYHWLNKCTKPKR